MNALIHNGQSHDFATADELLALDRVREFTTDSTVSHLLYNADELWAAKGNPTVLCLVGRLKERVALPAQVRAS